VLDIDDIVPITKATPHGPRSEGMMLLQQGYLLQRTPNPRLEKLRQIFTLALARFQATLASDPTSQENLSLAANAVSALLVYDETRGEELKATGQKYYQLILEAYPEDSGVRCQYIEFLINSGAGKDLDEIEDHWLLALEFDPKTYYAYFLYAKFLATERQEPIFAKKFLSAGKQFIHDERIEEDCQSAIDAAHDFPSKVKNLFSSWFNH